MNEVAAELLGLSPGTCGAESGMHEGKGIVKLFENGGNKQILVAGWDSIDTRIAAQSIIKLSDQMGSSESTISGNLNNPSVD